jgi:hypothetical protein
MKDRSAVVALDERAVDKQRVDVWIEPQVCERPL